MKPRAVRMPDALWERIEHEAAQRGQSAAAFVRETLRNQLDAKAQREDTSPETSHVTAHDGAATPRHHPQTKCAEADRLDDLEARVQNLEAAIDTTTAARQDGATQKQGQDQSATTPDSSSHPDSTTAATGATETEADQSTEPTSATHTDAGEPIPVPPGMTLVEPDILQE